MPQQLGARFGGRSRRGRIADPRHAHEIPRQHNQFSAQTIHHGDGRAQRMDGKIWVVMKVAENRDGEAVQPHRPAPQHDFTAHDHGAVRLDQRGINGQCGHASGRCKPDESPPRRRKKRQKWCRTFYQVLRGTRPRFFQDKPTPPVRDRTTGMLPVRKRTWLAVQCGGSTNCPAKTGLPAENWKRQKT